MLKRYLNIVTNLQHSCSWQSDMQVLLCDTVLRVDTVDILTRIY